MSTTETLCTYCHRPMADGGAPLPGEGRAPDDRACATCHDRFRRDLPLITKPTSQRPDPICEHGVSLDEDCRECDEEILADLEAEAHEVVD